MSRSSSRRGSSAIDLIKAASQHLFSFPSFVVLGVTLALLSSAQIQAAEVTVPSEHGKLIRAPQALGVLGTDLFGDKVNIYTGAVSFQQMDVTLPGNSTLPVAVGRTTTVGTSGNKDNGLFKNWELDIPRISGAFSQLYGWQPLASNGQPSLGFAGAVMPSVYSVYHPDR